MKLIARLACSLFIVGALFVATEHKAHALGPIDLEAGLKVGVGTNPNSDGPNPFGFGVGARAGVGIYHLWLGVSGMHYFGSSQDFPVIGKEDVSTNMFGGELGYTITLIPLLQIRPLLGVGDAAFNASIGDTSNSKGYLYLEPGVTVLIPLGLMFVGADVNALIIPSVDNAGTNGSSATYTSLTVHGQFGIRL